MKTQEDLASRTISTTSGSSSIFKLIASYLWSHCQVSPSPGWWRMGILPPSPRWGWRVQTWAEQSRLPRHVRLRGRSWGRKWWSKAHLVSCQFGRWHEVLGEEEGLICQHFAFQLSFRIHFKSIAARQLTDVTFLAQSINIRGRLCFKQLRVFPGFLSTGWIDKYEKTHFYNRNSDLSNNLLR